jgi:hypothetical protein
MSQERLNLLSLMNIEDEVLRAVDFSTDLILNLRRSSPVISRRQRKMLEYGWIFQWSDFTLTYLRNMLIQITAHMTSLTNWSTPKVVSYIFIY